MIQRAFESRVYSMDFTKTSFVVSRLEEQQGYRQNLLYGFRAAEFRTVVRCSLSRVSLIAKIMASISLANSLFFAIRV